MRVNHTNKFLKFVHTKALFSHLFAQASGIYFISVLVLIKMVISQKLLQRLILIYPRMPIVIREKWVWSNLQVQSNLALREIFVTAYLSLKVKFLLKSSFRNIISEPYISPTEKRKTFFSLSLSFPTAFNLPNSQYMIIYGCILSKTTIGHPF